MRHFTYEEDTIPYVVKPIPKYAGRIKYAYGKVQPTKVDRPPLPTAVIEYCDVLFDPNKPFQGRTSAQGGPNDPHGRSLWHSGHIIAYALGGSNLHPFNFYPQMTHSNLQHDRWG